MYRESTFDAYAVRNSSYSEVFANAGALTSNYNAFEHLNAFVAAFDNFYVYTYGIPGCKLRNIIT